jgi:hypothetical protein
MVLKPVTNKQNGAVAQKLVPLNEQSRFSPHNYSPWAGNNTERGVTKRKSQSSSKAEKYIN